MYRNNYCERLNRWRNKNIGVSNWVLFYFIIIIFFWCIEISNSNHKIVFDKNLEQIFNLFKNYSKLQNSYNNYDKIPNEYHKIN